MTGPKSLLAAALLLAVPALAGEWTIDPAHTSAEFAVKHMMVTTVRGHFENISGVVDLNQKDLTKSKVNVTIDAKTLNTRQSKRDEHLRSADFFDVEKHPNITFTSTRVAKARGGGFKVTGDLSMRGVTKAVVLDVGPLGKSLKNPWGQTVRGVTASATINRKDWGLSWNKALESGGVLVGDAVKLQIDAELIEKPAAQGKQAGAK